MSDGLFRNGWFGLVLSLLLSACASSGAPPSAPTDQALFSLQPAQSRQTLRQTPGANANLQTLLDAPSTADIRLVNLKPLLVAADTQALTLPLPDGSTARFRLMRIDRSMDGMTGWIGDIPSDRKQRFPSPAEVDMDPFNWIVLLREGERVVGSIHVAGQSYRLEPIGAGQHVLVKVDESRRPPQHDDAVQDPPGMQRAPAGKQPSLLHGTIRVLMVTTRQSRIKFPDNRLQMAQALLLANQYLINSRIDLVYELARFYDADYDSTGLDRNRQLDDLRLPSRALGKAVYEQRDFWGADLVSMLTTDIQGCGAAYVSATKASGYSVLECFDGVLAHELGHNLGTTHEWSGVEDPRGPPYMFGYGRTTAPVFHTVMKTSHGSIPYFSNPRLHYRGVPMGTVEHADAARRINEYRGVVEHFYPKALMVTLYENTDYQGRSCTLVMLGSATKSVAEACGCEWAWIASSVRVDGITPATLLEFKTSQAQGRQYYYSHTYRGRLDIPSFDRDDALPEGLSRTRTGEPLNDRVASIFTSSD